VRRRLVLVAVGVVVGGMVLGTLSWAGWYVIDNIGAPGPAATGSGPCGPGDSVNLELLFADGHIVKACTRDRPACPNLVTTGTNVSTHTTSSVTRFSLNNQLRSSLRRYILGITFNAALPAQSAERTLPFDASAMMLGPPMAGSLPSTLSAASVGVISRDPTDAGSNTVSGSLSVSASGGIARGSFSGSFGASSTTQPVTVTGSFACNH